MSESNPEGRFTIGHQDDNVTQDTTLAFYEGNAKQYYDDTVNTNMTVLYTPFLTYMPTYASILDAGCGSGRDTLYFASRGYQVTAFRLFNCFGDAGHQTDRAGGAEPVLSGP